MKNLVTKRRSSSALAGRRPALQGLLKGASACPGHQLRPIFLLCDIPAQLVNQAYDLFHFYVIDTLWPIVNGVVIRVQARVKEDGRNACLQERPLIAAAHQV